MTKLLGIFSALFLLTSLPAYAGHHEEMASTDVATHAKVASDVVVKVDGMVCDFCAQSLKKVFKKEEAVKDIDVNLDTGEITIDFKDGQSLSHDAITKLVVDSGYTVTAMVHASATE